MTPADAAREQTPQAEGRTQAATPRPSAQSEAPSPSIRIKGPWRHAIADFAGNRTGMIGLFIIVIMLLFSFVGPLLYPTDQVHNDLFRITRPPSAQFPLGTDEVGYNVLGRLMVAGQSSLEVGLAAAVIAGVLGTLWGAIAGLACGWIDSVMMRVVMPCSPYRRCS